MVKVSGSVGRDLFKTNAQYVWVGGCVGEWDGECVHARVWRLTSDMLACTCTNLCISHASTHARTHVRTPARTHARTHTHTNLQ
jgi:hypothetical protein